MCLMAGLKRTSELQQESGTVTVYKVYLLHKDKYLRSIFVDKNFIKKPGIIKASRDPSAIEYIGQGDDKWFEVDHGIHVYLEEKSARAMCEYHSNRHMVKLEADYKDLLGVAYDPANSHAVFSKVRLSRKEWKRVVPLYSFRKRFANFISEF